MKLKEGRLTIKELKESGQGTAVFATFNVVDLDQDVTMPGAFGTQSAKLMPAHDWSSPAIGIVKVYESANEALADFEFNLGMDAAKEWYRSLKFNFDRGIQQEFSYGYDVLSSRFEQRDGRQVRVLEKLKVHEVSPVLIGAGVNTRLLTMKGLMRTMDAQADDVYEENLDFWNRCKALAALRSKEGRTLSRATRDRLTRLRPQLTGILSAIDTLLAESDRDEELAQTIVQDDDGKTANLSLLDVEIIEGQLRRARG